MMKKKKERNNCTSELKMSKQMKTEFSKTAKKMRDKNVQKKKKLKNKKKIFMLMFFF
jgi:hypothetical protein